MWWYKPRNPSLRRTEYDDLFERYPGLYSKTMIKSKNKGKGRQEEREAEKLSPRIVLYTKRGKFATCPSSINKGDVKTTVSLDTK